MKEPNQPNALLPELGGFAPNGFTAPFADGSVRSLRKSINPRTLKALIRPNNGEVLSSDE